MAWFFILPLSVLAGPAGLAVALTCFAASRQKVTTRYNGTPSVEQVQFDAWKRQPFSSEG